MSFVFRGALVAALLAASAAPALSADAPVELKFAAMNGSGETGVAIITRQGDKTQVDLKMTGGTADAQPAHFHTGTCDKYGPRPLYPLHPVVKGTSTTTLDVPIDKLVSGDLVINVHKSLDDIATIASCAVAKAK